MRLRPRYKPIVVVLVALSAPHACGDDEELRHGADGESDAGLPVWGEAGAVGANDGGPVRAAFGLDVRPPNPTCLAGPRPTGTTEVELVDAFPNLFGYYYLIGATQAPGDPTRWYGVKLSGQVMTWPNDPTVVTHTEFLVMPPGRVRQIGEGGLLGFAFDPAWSTNRTAYISYTTGPAGQPDVMDTSVISRIKSTDGGNTLDPTTEEVLLTLAQPFTNHNGGQIAFGHDGYLYIGFGDGGDANDPLDNGQRLDTLHGKILRIGVGPNGPYSIPADNPFVGVAGARPEIWAYGFRNPWRWSFDRMTGDLWVGDVGQNIWEEIDIVQKGGNYGWKLREGKHCRYPTTPPCDGDGSLIDPVAEYEHDYGFTGPGSITGGYVYRGSTFPELQGAYFFADFSNVRVSMLTFDPVTNTPLQTRINEEQYVAGFAEDLAGEIYAINFASAHMYQIKRKAATQVNAFPAKLSATGCFDAMDPKKPLSALVPYDINAPFWSDGAEKRRWVALPDGTSMLMRPDGDIDFPNGTVLAKEFVLGGKRVETRLFVKHTNGEWAGYSYEWNETETEAYLLPSSKTRRIGTQDWLFPSRGQCASCHTMAAGHSLGLEKGQLARDMFYSATNRISPQIETLAHIGMVQNVAVAADVSPMPDPFGAAPLEERARSYLHANCSHCHRPAGPGRGAFDLRWGLPLAETKLCDATPTAGSLGLVNAKLVAAGDPARSVVLKRMKSEQAYRMPPLGRDLVDGQGAAIVESWIQSLEKCPVQ